MECDFDWIRTMEPGNQTMISPLTRHSFLLSSRTVFMLLSQCRAPCILKYRKSKNLKSTTLALQFSCTITSYILIKSLRTVDCMKSTKYLPSAKDFYFRGTRSIEHPPAHQTWPQMVKSKANLKISQGCEWNSELCSQWWSGCAASLVAFLISWHHFNIFQPFPSERKLGQTFAICHPCESEN